MNGVIGRGAPVNALLRAVIGAAVLFLLLPSCGKEQNQDQTVPTITFWHSFVATTVPALDDLLAEFRRVHPGIQINAEYEATESGLDASTPDWHRLVKTAQVIPSIRPLLLERHIDIRTIIAADMNVAADRFPSRLRPAGR